MEDEAELVRVYTEDGELLCEEAIYLPALDELHIPRDGKVYVMKSETYLHNGRRLRLEKIDG